MFTKLNGAHVRPPAGPQRKPEWGGSLSVPPNSLRGSAVVWLVVGALPLVVAFTGGCNRAADTATLARLRGVTNLYLDYAVAKGQGPATEKDLERELKTALPFALEQAGICPDAKVRDLISERDGQPFMIRYGLPLGQVTLSQEIIACEKTGLDGVRYCAFANGEVRGVESAAAELPAMH